MPAYACTRTVRRNARDYTELVVVQPGITLQHWSAAAPLSSSSSSSGEHPRSRDRTYIVCIHIHTTSRRRRARGVSSSSHANRCARPNTRTQHTHNSSSARRPRRCTCIIIITTRTLRDARTAVSRLVPLSVFFFSRARARSQRSSPLRASLSAQPGLCRCCCRDARCAFLRARVCVCTEPVYR